MTLEEKYPFIASWVVDGEIHIGRASQDYGHQPYAGVYDAGGIVWEMDRPFTSLDEVFEQMERAIGLWCREQGIELVDSRGRAIPFPIP
ncbi:MAG: hypothetical protein V9G20_06545 [Candidatus Promineifilaceae bacterium]